LKWRFLGSRNGIFKYNLDEFKASGAEKISDNKGAVFDSSSRHNTDSPVATDVRNQCK
jgi:hypothetical protein